MTQWRADLLGCFGTFKGTEANNGLMELHRCTARGFRSPDNYGLRMLLVGGGHGS